MKTIALEKDSPTLADVLRAATDDEVVYLTRGGRASFAVVPLDDADAELVAQRGNVRLMDFLTKCEERARTQPRKSLRELRSQLADESERSAAKP